MTVAARTRLLPGIRFEAEPPLSPRTLPRMDVTAFVGFAASGPIGVPVAVEDTAQFAAIFGDDAALAWDVERGEQAYAQLAPAVRSFFRNGGRRAWVVRVAGPSARTTFLQAPGLVAREPGGELGFASLPARSSGSWADALRVGVALSSSPGVLLSASLQRLAFRVEAGAAKIVAGDLLRLHAGGYELLVAVRALRVTKILPRGAAPAPGRTVLTIVGDPATALWLDHAEPSPGATGGAHYVDSGGAEQTATAHVGGPAAPPPLSPPEPPAARAVELDLEVVPALAPQPGTLVRVEGLWSDPARVLWVRVESLGSREAGRVRVRGSASSVLPGAPVSLPALHPDTAVEKLTFELWARRGDAERFVVDGLGFAPGHPRYVGDLPLDEALYERRELALEPDPELWAVAADPRFPLAGASGGPVYYPLAVDVVADTFLGPLRSAGSPLERDGLERFDDALFLDGDLRASGVESLAAEAEYVRWQSPRPRTLEGIHSLFDAEEVTVVSVPDAAHRRWHASHAEAVPLAPPSLASPPASPPVPGVPVEEFVDCELHELVPTPELTLEERDLGGSFGLSWTPVDDSESVYVLEESTDRTGWKRARTIYSGPKLSIRLYGRTGTYFYRVRAEAGRNLSEWSNGVAVGSGAGVRYEVEAEDAYRPDVLLAVQRSLLRLCAARGDLLAVLSVPEHYRADAAVAHARRLRAGNDPLPPPGSPGSPDRSHDPVPALGGTEQRALGFGALYHPWLVLSQPELGDAFRRVPPDGTAAGVIAKRAATRGAWIAPANDAFADVIALVHPSPREQLAALQEAQVNEVRQEPGGFTCLCEDTLVRTEEIRPINVRRLLSLVRRLVLREGVRYVFEPNDGVFRRGVERGLGELMQMLYLLGAFAGRTPDEAFRVSVGDPPNTAQSIDQGRLIVELKLAPSRPLAFLLVRLVAGGERGFELVTP